jgi:hypothetical protein
MMDACAGAGRSGSWVSSTASGAVDGTGSCVLQVGWRRCLRALQRCLLVMAGRNPNGLRLLPLVIPEHVDE